MNTFLELKMENERLQQRVLDLKARAVHSNSKLQLPSASSSSSSSTNPYPSTSRVQMLEDNPPSLVDSNPNAKSHFYYDDFGGHSSVSNYDSGSGVGLVPYGGLQSFGGGAGTNAGTEQVMDDFDEDGFRRKKVCPFIHHNNILRTSNEYKFFCPAYTSTAEKDAHI
jgi:hypothetical protein